MSDTAGKPNGEAAESMLNLVPESSYITGQREAPSARHVFVSKPLLTEHIDPQDLYRVFSPEEKGFVVDAPIARISQSVAECLPHIVQAINEADELQRENHVSLALPNVFALARFAGVSTNFDDALALLLGALAAHRSAPYSRDELLALQRTLEKLRRNPTPTDEDVSLLYSSLEDAGFDLNAPLEGLDLSPVNEG